MRWFFLSSSPYLNGGFQTLTFEMAEVLLDSGHEVHFMCFQGNPYIKLADKYDDSLLFHEPVNIDTRSISFRHVLSAYKMLKKANPDVLFFCNSGSPDFLPFMIAAKILGIKDVVMHVGTEVDLPKPVKPARYLFGLLPGIGLWRKKFIFSCRLACRFVSLTLCNNTQQMMDWQKKLRLDPAKTMLWYPPMDLRKFQANSMLRKQYREKLSVSSQFVVGCVGHLNKQKSFDVAIRAFSVFRKTHKDSVLIIAGEGPERSSLESLIDELCLHGSVQLLGDRKDVPDLMNAFDLFCLPSTLANETLGIVILEAMATKVPVVTTNLPGPARLSKDGDCSLTVNVGDYEELATAWGKIYKDNDLRKRLVSNALDQVAMCDREKVVGNLLQLLGV